MLFYPNWSNIFDYIYYDEPSSILFIKYVTREIKEYYKVDRSFFYLELLPLLKAEKEFRSILHWGIRQELAIKLDENIPEFELVDLKVYSKFKRK